MSRGEDAARTTRTGDYLVTLDEAARKLSVPIGTLYSWTAPSRRRLTACAIGPGGKHLYNLDEVRKLAEETRRRGPRNA